MRSRQAVFLVGGKGTRLGTMTQTTPKPLLEIAPGIRFLDVVLEEVTRQGFDDILLLAGYLGDQVEAAYQGKSIHGAIIRVMRESEPQGTGGALRFAREALAPSFIAGNGDSLFEINLRSLAQPLATGVSARLALRQVSDPARYGTVDVTDGRITAFHEKNKCPKVPALINGGVYYMQHEIIDSITGPCSIEQDVFPRLAEEGRLEGKTYDGFFIDIGLPDTYEQAQAEVPTRRVRPCAFLDRDGVINVDRGYTHRPEDLQFIKGAPEAIRLLNDAGYYVIVVTNQAGVAHGLYELAEVDSFHLALDNALAESGAFVDAYYACPYHPDGVIAEFTHPNHPDRKPNPGMIRKAAAEWPINMGRSFLIGDKNSDLLAARAAGVVGYKYDNGDLVDLVLQAMACSR